MPRTISSVAKSIGAAWPHWAPAALFFAATAVFALLYHYPVLYFDHWDIVPYYQRLMEGALKPGDLFTPHGTHWHAGGYAVMLGLATLTGMTQTPEIIASLMLAVIACGALYALLRDAWRRLHQPTAPVLFAVIAFFLFSADQSENWLWGWQVSVFLNVAGAATCMALLARRDGKTLSLVGAMLAAAIAIYSFATGLALLPAGLVVLLFKRPRLDARLMAWTTFSVAIALHYKIAVLDWRPQYVASITPQALDAGSLGSLTHFTLDLIGGAVGRFTNGLPLIASLLGLVVGAYSLWRMTSAERAATAGAVGLSLYGLGAAALIAFGRLGFDTATISRYITFANFFWIGVVTLAFFAMRVEPNTTIGVAARVLFGLLLIGKIATIANVLTGSNAGLVHAAEIRRAGFVLCRFYPDIPADVRAEITAPDQNIEQRMAYLANHRLSTFHDCPVAAR